MLQGKPVRKSRWKVHSLFGPLKNGPKFNLETNCAPVAQLVEHCAAGGCGFQPQPDQHAPRESAAFVISSANG